ncbi:hypothetical protein PC9H_000465 [Pleurotus ostreatus]|uniref:Class I hydrophobin 16 n=2 Tax=Pleurotus ostreatus TaxID=5322 RepID=HYD16_PLEO1|nr:uncharacterized protein PC9H_000465 [Pleurotus ostreatus]KAF7440121.1 hypothetical protein PC9H_000465 [Pleurotus ostreatus]KDQ32927.1 class I hydrophobin superfamily [Pleurotus ostreatus PC15]
MKFTSVIALVATAATLVGAVPFETNAERLARGLPPLPPARRASGVEAAKPKPSPSHGCSTGPVQCCNDLVDRSNHTVGILIGLLGIVLGPVTGLFGLGCSPLLGGGAKCQSQTVCCSDNKFSGIINIGCSPINIGL